VNSVVEERMLRQLIMDRLAERTAHNGGFITRAELSAFPVDGQDRRLVDTTRGIWNPRDLLATLSVVSSPDGPYDDRDVEGGLFRYDYRAGSSAGDNTKLRRAAELSCRSFRCTSWPTTAQPDSSRWPSTRASASCRSRPSGPTTSGATPNAS
jgi:hypothetical protein